MASSSIFPKVGKKPDVSWLRGVFIEEEEVETKMFTMGRSARKHVVLTSGESTEADQEFPRPLCLADAIPFRTRSYNFGATRFGTIHSPMGCTPPQSKHFVTANWAAQCGQTACVWNVSNDFLHCPHIQKPPTGGAALHLGQTNPS